VFSKIVKFLGKRFAISGDCLYLQSNFTESSSAQARVWWNW